MTLFLVERCTLKSLLIKRMLFPVFWYYNEAEYKAGFTTSRFGCCVSIDLLLLFKSIGFNNRRSDNKDLQNVKGIFSSEAFVLVKDQIAKARADIAQYQSIFEKLQVEKDNLGWLEKEFNIKNDIGDALHQSFATSDSRISDLQMEIKNKLMKEIIAEFRNLVSTFPKDMGSMQTQLREHKEASSNIHSLRADVQSLNTILDRKMKELEALSGRSAAQSAEIQKLHATIHDL
ncbi:hypothetical protein L1987_60280 [Smallanthus sonchifolius]|uniref:Uncharacterized protein n=1 Tax=Smallanthus sonchifolius TaxID=185202 RepID=A0ACB9D892_9ASTR|nr:hypothetical protein L1987_60280 [Smallanthus sonchifolius]